MPSVVLPCTVINVNIASRAAVLPVSVEPEKSCFARKSLQSPLLVPQDVQTTGSVRASLLFYKIYRLVFSEMFLSKLQSVNLIHVLVIWKNSGNLRHHKFYENVLF